MNFRWTILKQNWSNRLSGCVCKWPTTLGLLNQNAKFLCQPTLDMSTKIYSSELWIAPSWLVLRICNYKWIEWVSLNERLHSGNDCWPKVCGYAFVWICCITKYLILTEYLCQKKFKRWTVSHTVSSSKSGIYYLMVVGGIWFMKLN